MSVDICLGMLEEKNATIAELTAERDRMRKALERISAECPPLSEYKGDLESDMESGNSGDYAKAFSAKSDAYIGDIAREALASSPSSTTITDQPPAERSAGWLDPARGVPGKSLHESGSSLKPAHAKLADELIEKIAERMFDEYDGDYLEQYDENKNYRTTWTQEQFNNEIRSCLAEVIAFPAEGDADRTLILIKGLFASAIAHGPGIESEQFNNELRAILESMKGQVKG